MTDISTEARSSSGISIPKATDGEGRISVAVDAGRRRVAVRGEVDAHTCGLIDDHLTWLSTRGDVTLDLSGTSFMDSTGLRVIVTAHNSLKDAGYRLRLATPSEPVLRLLTITGLHTVLHVEGLTQAPG